MRQRISSRFEIGMFIMRGLVMFIAVSNLWFGFIDNDREVDLNIYPRTVQGMSTLQRDKLKSCSFDLVTISNMLLLGGVLLDWYVLIGIWVLIYAFVILVGSLQFAFQGSVFFHQLPGFSKSMAKSLATTFDFGQNFQPAIGTMIIMFNFCIILAYLFMCAYSSFLKKETARLLLPTINTSITDPGARPRCYACDGRSHFVGIARSRGDIGGNLNFVSNTSTATFSTNISSNDGLPTYSEAAEMQKAKTNNENPSTQDTNVPANE